MPPNLHLTSLPTKVVSDESATDRMVAKLSDPDAVFTRDQVAWLMGTAQRWGYETRELEENEEYARREPVTVLGRWYDQAEYRAQADAAARLARTTDYHGGPVAWDDTTTEAAA